MSTDTHDHPPCRRCALIAEKQDSTYAEMALKYEVNQWYLWNIVKTDGYEPPAWVRRKLGMTLEKPRNRRAVNLDDPASAAATIRKAASAEYRRELSELLRG